MNITAKKLLSNKMFGRKKSAWFEWQRLPETDAVCLYDKIRGYKFKVNALIAGYDTITKWCSDRELEKRTNIWDRETKSKYNSKAYLTKSAVVENGKEIVVFRDDENDKTCFVPKDYLYPLGNIEKTMVDIAAYIGEDGSLYLTDRACFEAVFEPHRVASHIIDKLNRLKKIIDIK